MRIRLAANATGLLLLLLLFGCAPTEPPPEPEPQAGPVVRVLGSVQDGGLPHSACDCARCERARSDPASARLVSSLGVIFPAEGLRFLIDATPDIRPQLHALGAVGRRPVDGMLLTHAHIGHYLGLAFFGFEATHAERVPVYCTPELAEFLRTNAPWDQLVRLENIVINELDHGETIELHPDLSVTVVAVPHRDEYADTVGFILQGPERSLLYVPDTDAWAAWDPPLPELLDGIDIAIIDGTFYSLDELPGRDISAVSHPLISDSMDLLEPLVKSGKIEVRFTHLNHSNPALDPEGEEIGSIRERGFDVVREGEEFPI
jgi:pyrroloquinoline quinone biosynthesis protein B